MELFSLSLYYLRTERHLREFPATRKTRGFFFYKRKFFYTRFVLPFYETGIQRLFIVKINDAESSRSSRGPRKKKKNTSANVPFSSPSVHSVAIQRLGPLLAGPLRQYLSLCNQSNVRITYGKAEIGTSGRPHTRSNKPSERKKAETFHFERVSTIFFYRSSPRRRSRNESNNGVQNSILSRTLRECRFTKGRVIRKYLATVERCFFIATINLAFEPSRCIIVDNDRVLEDDLSYNKLDP